MSSMSEQVPAAAALGARFTLTKVRRAVPELLLAVTAAGVAFSSVVRPLTGSGGYLPRLGSGVDPWPRVSVPVDAVLTATAGPAVDPSTLGIPVPGGLQPGMSVGIFRGLTDGERFGLVGGQVLLGLISVAALVVMLLLARSLRRRRATRAGVSRGLFVVAALVGLGGQAAVLLRTSGENHALGRSNLPVGGLDPHQVSWAPLVIGLAVAVVAHVVRRVGDSPARVD